MSGSAALQDHYPDPYAWCYGCGRLNTQGLHVKTYWDGDGTVARFTPRPEHMAYPGFVYGGLLASLIDCHAMGTASAASLRAEGKAIGESPSPRFVTAALNVSYLRPTPLGPELEVRAHIIEVTARKTVMGVTVSAQGVVTVQAHVVAAPIPGHMDRSG